MVGFVLDLLLNTTRSFEEFLGIDKGRVDFSPVYDTVVEGCWIDEELENLLDNLESNNSDVTDGFGWVRLLLKKWGDFNNRLPRRTK